MLFSKSAADDTQRVRVKICGITREDDVVAAVDAGADAVGFICYAGSPRFVSPSRLMSLASLVPPSVTKVLLFVNPKAEEVREYLSFVPDATLQFHGNESRAFCDQFHVRYIKAVSIDKPERSPRRKTTTRWQRLSWRTPQASPAAARVCPLTGRRSHPCEAVSPSPSLSRAA